MSWECVKAALGSVNRVSDDCTSTAGEPGAATSKLTVMAGSKPLRTPTTSSLPEHHKGVGGRSVSCGVGCCCTPPHRLTIAVHVSHTVSQPSVYLHMPQRVVCSVPAVLCSVPGVHAVLPCRIQHPHRVCVTGATAAGLAWLGDAPLGDVVTAEGATRASVGKLLR